MLLHFFRCVSGTACIFEKKELQIKENVYEQEQKIFFGAIIGTDDTHSFSVFGLNGIRCGSV